jgi:5-methylcytosine-specific restriction endonuclease McrA
MGYSNKGRAIKYAPTREAHRIRCDGKCAYCGVKPRKARDGHLDHLIPRSLGGSNAPDNIVYACKKCNEAKGDRSVFDWLRLRPLVLARVLEIAARPLDREAGRLAAISNGWEPAQRQYQRAA